MENKIILVRTGDTHPAHTLTYYALLGITPEIATYIKSWFNTAGEIPYEFPVFFLDDAMNSTVAKQFPERHTPTWDLMRRLDPDKKVQLVPQDIEEIIGTDSDDVEFNALELSGDHEVNIQYMHYNKGQSNSVPMFRIWAHLEFNDEDPDNNDGAGWSAYTEWIPLSFLDPEFLKTDGNK